MHNKIDKRYLETSLDLNYFMGICSHSKILKIIFISSQCLCHVLRWLRIKLRTKMLCIGYMCKVKFWISLPFHSSMFPFFFTCALETFGEFTEKRRCVDLWIKLTYFSTDKSLCYLVSIKYGTETVLISNTSIQREDLYRCLPSHRTTMRRPHRDPGSRCGLQ